ncbi:iron chelate uptake ABC transporter family permease subunit [Paenibacillus sp. Aloe-11]|uniref:iron chelate uptake ABC transporter family permease subunit n=1 Tax=Paenibacillus sp. Aloe-11 TaxID=1050222 RepID=UPI00024F01BC|nr:iron chelate uptake ABC transporter family permease subunit [Paenibacillus sp. Aloe-11]EHS55817.1 enterochelin ABC transporter permease [Paenibacillus sp. Aloe-11]
MNPKLKIGILAAAALLLIVAFVFVDLPHTWHYALLRRLKKIAAFILTGGSIAFATVIFQTITNNKILTPGIIGLDSLYMLIQTTIVFAFGSVPFISTSRELNFLLSVGLMVLFAGLLYKLIFRKDGRGIYVLLLIGLVFGTLFNSLSTFMEVLIDPNEYAKIQDKSFASFSNVNTELLWLSVVILVLVFAYAWRFIKYLDVLSLGREHAINLGLPYGFIIKRLLVIVAILISISTALVGPITFLGLIVANVAYQVMKTYQHRYIIPASILVSVIALAGCQLLAERVFDLTTTVSVIINFIGGVYFLYLLLRENKSW